MIRDVAMTRGRVATLRDALTVLPRRQSWLHRIVRIPLRLLLWAGLRAGLRLRAEGDRCEGPAVIVSNHPHVIDGLVVLLADPRLRPIARWHRIPLLRSGMWVSDCIITTTGTGSRPPRRAFAPAFEHVKRGGRVWIAPEGGWQPERTLRYPRTGAVRMAAMARVPVQVLAVLHEHHPGPDLTNWRPWHRPRIVLRWGQVLTMTGDVARDIDRTMSAIADASGTTWDPQAQDAEAAPGQRPR